MDEKNLKPVPPEVAPADVLDGLALDMVEALDRILEDLVAAAPAEGAEGEFPLTLQEVRVVKTLVHRGSVNMSVLAGALGISMPTATHLVDRLVAKGAAVRTRPEHDRRLVLVALSDRKKAHEQAFFENRVAMIRTVLEPLDPAAREHVVKAIGEMARMLQARVTGPAADPDSQ